MCLLTARPRRPAGNVLDRIDRLLLGLEALPQRLPRAADRLRGDLQAPAAGERLVRQAHVALRAGHLLVIPVPAVAQQGSFGHEEHRDPLQEGILDRGWQVESNGRAEQHAVLGALQAQLRDLADVGTGQSNHDKQQEQGNSAQRTFKQRGPSAGHPAGAGPAGRRRNHRGH
jgi:hypothetical protein